MIDITQITIRENHNDIIWLRSRCDIIRIQNIIKLEFNFFNFIIILISKNVKFPIPYNDLTIYHYYLASVNYPYVMI